MSFTSYFSLPLHESAQAPSFRTLAYKQARKRKRNEDQNEEENSRDSDGNEHSDALSIARGQTQDVLSSGFTPITQRTTSGNREASADAKQHQLAGQPCTEPLPPFPFPHRAANPHGDRASSRGYTVEGIGAELASLSPPLYVPNASYIKTSASIALHQGSKLRQRHLSALTTVFHRCIFEGDFLRAGRAWGMLLRAEAFGKGVHIRREGRWGIGAEILLRRDTEASLNSVADDEDGWNSNDDHPLPARGMDAWFTRQGFEQARDYYERLILQYQFRRWHPHSISSLDFYPAMFATWIYFVQSESKARSRRKDAGVDMESTPSSNSPPEHPMRHRPNTETIAKETLKEAEEIASRMDELMLSPPYSDSHQLWNLRGMVALWINDLRTASHSTARGELNDGLMESEAGNYVENDVSNGAQKQGLPKSKEIETAKAAFEKARQRGAVIWEGYAHLFEEEIDDSER